MLGIIIINYNKYEKTFECIETIKNSSFKDYKIYLIDNASQNDSYDRLIEKYSNDSSIQLIKSEENLGYARGNNLGLEYAKKDNCKYALISNNDILYDENTIEYLYNKISENKFLLIGPKVVLPDGSIQISNMRKKPSFLHYIFYKSFVEKFLKDNNYLKNSGEVYWVLGCSFILNMEYFEKINNFDPYTFLYYEEYIIAERAKKEKLKLYYDDTVKVTHYHGASTGDVNVKVYLESLKSEMYFWKKYRNASNFKLLTLLKMRNFEIKHSLKKRKRINEYSVFQNESLKIYNEIKEI